MKADTELPVISFESQKKWEAWLKKHHGSSKGAWLMFFKKNSGTKGVSYAGALDVALCYGWIDSQLKKHDEKSYLQRFTPRGPKSMWSQKNTEHVVRLIKAKRMQAAGLRSVEAAKKDGRWDAAYASPSKISMPADFKKALAANKKAKAFYDGLNKANTCGILTRIHFAKKAETRAKKIKQFVEMLARGEKLHG